MESDVVVLSHSATPLQHKAHPLARMSARETQQQKLRSMTEADVKRGDKRESFWQPVGVYLVFWVMDKRSKTGGTWSTPEKVSECSQRRVPLGCRADDLTTSC